MMSSPSAVAGGTWLPLRRRSRGSCLTGATIVERVVGVLGFQRAEIELRIPTYMCRVSLLQFTHALFLLDTKTLYYHGTSSLVGSSQQNKTLNNKKMALPAALCSRAIIVPSVSKVRWT